MTDWWLMTEVTDDVISHLSMFRHMLLVKLRCCHDNRLVTWWSQMEKLIEADWIRWLKRLVKPVTCAVLQSVSVWSLSPQRVSWQQHRLLRGKSLSCCPTNPHFLCLTASEWSGSLWQMKTRRSVCLRTVVSTITNNMKITEHAQRWSHTRQRRRKQTSWISLKLTSVWLWRTLSVQMGEFTSASSMTSMESLWNSKWWHSWSKVSVRECELTAAAEVSDIFLFI